MYTPSGIVKVPAADRSYRTMATCSASSLEDRIRDLVKKKIQQTNSKKTAYFLFLSTQSRRKKIKERAVVIKEAVELYC